MSTTKEKTKYVSVPLELIEAVACIGTASTGDGKKYELEKIWINKARVIFERNA